MTDDLPPQGSPAAAGTGTAPPQPQPGPPQPSTDFFSSILRLGALRPLDRRWIAGVGSGLARRWNVDPVLVRGGFVALAVLGGAGVLLYGLLWLFLPQDDGRIHAQQVLRGDVSAGFFGGLVVTLIGLGGDGPGPWAGGAGVLLALLIVGGLIVWGNRQSTGAAPAPPQTQPADAAWGAPAQGPTSPTYPTYPTYPPSSAPRPRSASAPSRRISRATLGLALIAWVAGYLVEGALVGAAVALAVLGLGTMLAGLTGRRAGAPAVLAVPLALGVILGAAADHESFGQGGNFTLAGDRTWAPASVAQAEEGLTLGVGRLSVRLTDPALLGSAQPVTVPVQMGAGRLELVLPESVSVLLTIQQGSGAFIDTNGVTRSSSDDAAESEYTVRAGPAGEPQLEIRVQQGAGEIQLITNPTGA